MGIRKLPLNGDKFICDLEIFVTLAWIDDERVEMGQINTFLSYAKAEDWQEEWGSRIGPVDIIQTHSIVDVEFASRVLINGTELLSEGRFEELAIAILGAATG